MPTPTRTSQALPERLPPWGVGVIESHHAPDFEMEWRRHAFIKLIYVQAGAGTLHLDDAAHPFAARELLIAPSGIRNRLVDDAGRPATLYVLCLDRQLLRFDPSLEPRLAPGRQQVSADTAKRIEGLFRRLMFEQSHGGSAASIAMVASAMELLRLLIDRPPTPSARAPVSADAETDEVRDYAEQLATHFYEATTIDDAAAGLGMSRRKFTKAFRETTGQSWLAFVHGKAIDHASRRLVETEAPIAAVAFECGFEDLSTFYRRFKALLGCSPGEWRTRYAAEATNTTEPS